MLPLFRFPTASTPGSSYYSTAHGVHPISRSRVDSSRVESSRVDVRACEFGAAPLNLLGPAPFDTPMTESNDLEAGYERDWARRTVVMSAGYVALAAIVAVTTTYLDRHPGALVGLVVVPVFASLGYLGCSREMRSGDGPSPIALGVYRLSSLVGAAAWALGTVGALTDQLDANATVVVSGTAMLAAVTRWGVAFDPFLRKLMPIVLIVPMVVAAMATGAVQGMGAALICAAILAALASSGGFEAHAPAESSSTGRSVDTGGPARVLRESVECDAPRDAAPASEIRVVAARRASPPFVVHAVRGGRGHRGR